jgi:hypothetical protein
MPAIIDSSPDCVTNVEGAKPADDAADFIIQANYQDCAGFMTFGPGSTYGEGGSAAATSYYVLTGIGAAVMLACFVAWVVYENRRLIAFAAAASLKRSDETPPQPGTRIPEGT